MLIFLRTEKKKMNCFYSTVTKQIHTIDWNGKCRCKKLKILLSIKYLYLYYYILIIVDNYHRVKTETIVLCVLDRSALRRADGVPQLYKMLFSKTVCQLLLDTTIPNLHQYRNKNIMRILLWTLPNLLKCTNWL